MSIARSTLNRKLLRLVLGVQLMVAIATIGSVAWVNLRQEQRRLKEIEAQVQETIATKANAMVDNHALAMRGLVLDNTFTDIQKLVQHAVREDRDVIYGVFVSADGTPWAYASPTLPDGEPQDFLKQWTELSLSPDSWKNDKPRRREVMQFKQRVIEVSRPVIDNGEVLGMVCYGFSTEPLRLALEQVRADSRSALKTTLGSITLAVLLSTLIGFFLVKRAASRIVRPLESLTKAAQAIASGEKGVRVHVQTHDELEVLASAFNHMQQANEDALTQLSKAMDAALEASRLKGEFLANMSHEIRTPMNGIVGVSRLILRMPLEGKLRRYAETIETSANALMTIVNDILDFSKMEAGKYTLQSVAFDPTVLLQEVAELQSSRAADKALELIYRRAPNVPQMVTGDPDRYRQILNNLVGNAVKFTDHGEVFIELSVDEQREDSVVLRTIVQDTGIGINEGATARLFDAFSQVDGSMVRRHGGTGLGLAISKHLAELMGGKIGVKSEPGVGSTFWFTIEVQRSDAPTCPVPRRFVENRRALVVEANRRWARIIQEHMETWGLQCDVVQDGQPALERLRDKMHENPYDVAVIGAQLRDLSIELFVRELRGIPGAKKLPLIVLTQLGVNATLTEVANEVIAQIAKPLRLSELYNCLLRTFAGSPRASGAPRLAPRPPNTGRGRLLIVDDNEINRYVAAEQIDDAGFEADVACNGQEAVDMVKATRYAAVLMDCQMPVMDGYTAAQRIREWEADRQHTPIIALTAHAMVGERDKVLAAGMDDYLSKPLKPHSLERMLDRYVRIETQTAIAINSQPAPLELDTTIHRSGRLSTLFIMHAPKTLAEVDAALAAEDAGAARASAHKLKGSCLAIGAVPMADAAEAVQRAAEALDLAAARQRTSELHTRLSDVIALLSKELADAGAVKPRTGSSKPPPSLRVYGEVQE
jgi:signal transduction histidine kinase/CheY-like chemotaxis protein